MIVWFSTNVQETQILFQNNRVGIETEKVNFKISGERRDFKDVYSIKITSNCSRFGSSISNDCMNQQN